MKRYNPTRVIETGRVVRGAAGQPTGWLQSIAERMQNIRAMIQGVQDRLNSPLAFGPPGCASGELLFKANLQKTVTITNYPRDPDDTTPAFTTLTVNPIILAGETYRIPVMFPPPGTFMAHNLVVGIEAGFTTFNNQPLPGITPLNDYRQIGNGFVPTPASGVIQYTWAQQVLGEFNTLGGDRAAGVRPFLPFLWNIIDEKSGRQYAKSWMPHGALLNSRANASKATLGEGASGVEYPRVADSDLFEFDTPWLFERDAQVTFLFRPLMDLYQIAPGDALLPYASTDLSGGTRQQQATVRVEFHGNRYFETQDVLKDGARV